MSSNRAEQTHLPASSAHRHTTADTAPACPKALALRTAARQSDLLPNRRFQVDQRLRGESKMSAWLPSLPEKPSAHHQQKHPVVWPAWYPQRTLVCSLRTNDHPRATTDSFFQSPLHRSSHREPELGDLTRFRSFELPKSKCKKRS